MRKVAGLALFVLMAAMLVLGAQKQVTPASRVAGPARVIDGDTLVIRGRLIRILGIDAPERVQTCHDAAEETWPCGRHARQALVAHLDRQQVSCRVAGRDRYVRDLAHCASCGSDRAEWLDRERWAVAAGDEQGSHRATAREAEATRTGIWRGSLMRPADWRRAGDRQHREGTDDER